MFISIFVLDENQKLKNRQKPHRRGGTLHTSAMFGSVTVEPRFNEPLFNEVLDITNDILGPGQSYSKMYGIEP